MPPSGRRRISAMSTAGNTNKNRPLRRCKTQEVAANPMEIRTDKIRHWVVGFLGRTLTSEEEKILQDDCRQFPRDMVDHEAARTVVQSLLSACFLQGNPSEPKQRSSHLEAEAVQVKAMAVLKLQAVVRACVRRQWCHGLPGRQHAKAAAQKWVQQNRTQLPELGKQAAASMSNGTPTRARELKQALLDTVDVSAVILVQAWMRGYLCRTNKSAIEMISGDCYKLDESDQKTETTQPMDQSLELSHDKPESAAGVAEEPATLNPIPEPKLAKSASIRMMFDEHKDDSEPAMEDSQNGAVDNKNGMLSLTESQSQLSFVAQVVKETIAIKVQSLVRRFLVRQRNLRQRRMLQKAVSIRRMPLVVQGTLAEQMAATEIQRIFRGFVQRWKHWTAMRQQQLDDIQTLRAKQLRKIQERKKRELKSTKKQLFFDATSLARQLQRAKRVIKFLVKEEKRALAQNERLGREVGEWTAKNQLLENSTKTAANSNETLQREIQQLSQHNQSLQAKRTNCSQTLKSLTVECTKTNKQASAETKRKEQVRGCMAKVQGRAKNFLQEHPQLLLLQETTANGVGRPIEPPQPEKVTAT